MSQQHKRHYHPSSSSSTSNPNSSSSSSHPTPVILNNEVFVDPAIQFCSTPVTLSSSSSAPTSPKNVDGVRRKPSMPLHDSQNNIPANFIGGDLRPSAAHFPIPIPSQNFAPVVQPLSVSPPPSHNVGPLANTPRRKHSASPKFADFTQAPRHSALPPPVIVATLPPAQPKNKSSSDLSSKRSPHHSRPTSSSEKTRTPSTSSTPQPQPIMSTTKPQIVASVPMPTSPSLTPSSSTNSILDLLRVGSSSAPLPAPISAPTPVIGLKQAEQDLRRLMGISAN